MTKRKKIIIAATVGALCLLVALLSVRPPCSALQEEKACALFPRGCNWGTPTIDCGSAAGDRCEDVCYAKRGNEYGGFAVWSDRPYQVFIKIFTGEPLK